MTRFSEISSLTFQSAINIRLSAAVRRAGVSWFSTVCLIFTLLAGVLRPSVGWAQTVDLELVFAADGSGSIDDDELRLQRDGYAAALSNPKVLEAIAGGQHGRIAVAYVEW